MLSTRNCFKVSIALPKQDASLYLRLENTSPMETTAKVMDPNGKSYDIEVRDIGDCLYQISFKPEMDGSHAISVFNKGQHVSGKLSYIHSFGHLNFISSKSAKQRQSFCMDFFFNFRKSVPVYCWTYHRSRST